MADKDQGSYRPLSDEEKAQILIDTTKTEVEIEKLRVDISLATLDATKREAEIKQALAQARTYELQSQSAELDMQVKRRGFEEAMAGDKLNGVYRFTETVKEATIQHCMDKLTVWHRMSPKSPIEVLFYSPGGDVFAGMALYDFLRELRSYGHPITTGAYGRAASMAGVLLQAGDVRWMGSQTYLLIHEVGSQMAGKQGELKDEMALLSMMMDNTLEIYAERSAAAHKAGTAKKAWTVSEIKKKINKTDWWINSKTALEAGFVDVVR